MALTLLGHASGLSIPSGLQKRMEDEIVEFQKRGLSGQGSLLSFISAGCAAFLLAPTSLWADGPAPVVDKGDTAWMLISSALVLFMTPGLAFFYGGMVRKKNVLGTLMQSYIAMGALSIVWAVIGFSLAFGVGNDWVGDLSFLGLQGVGAVPGPAEVTSANTIPFGLFMVYQGMFFVITPALISGAIAERIKFSAYLLILVLWSLVVYAPLCHMVWSPSGWLFKDGALDFAGGTVVHVSAATAAGVLVFMLGKRKDFARGEAILPHSLPLSVLGTGMLWFGWFGFNAGSALAASDVAVNAFITTNLGAAAAAMGWTLYEWFHRGKPTNLGFISGAVAGLVVITPACGFVSPMGAIAMGLIGGVACYNAVQFRARLKIDDSLDVLGVHGVGGALGALLTGVFATKAVNSAGKDGLLYGGGIEPVIKQAIAVGFTIVMVAVLTFILAKVVDLLVGLRVDEESEQLGLDLSQHEEVGYNF